MRKIFTFLSLLFINSMAWCQTSYPNENVGVPASENIPVSTYTGWVNYGTLTFTGSATVQDSIPSTGYSNASASGNVFFDSTAGINFQISNINASSQDGTTLYFGMYNFDTLFPTDLTLEYSTNGTTYKPWHYKRKNEGYVDFVPHSWDIMQTDELPSVVTSSNFRIRFTQTSSTTKYRIDDLNIYLLHLSNNAIKINSFAALKNVDNVTLNWEANTTTLLDKFTVEKSSDGINYNDLITIPAASEGENNYNYKDLALPVANSYYRLKLIEATGKISYSQVIKISSSNASAMLLQDVFPLPASNNLTLQVKSTSTQKATVLITDMIGRTISKDEFSVSNGVNALPINIKQHSVGVHNLVVYTTDGNMATKQILLQ